MSDKGKILIVEDEHRIARFLQMELQHEGFEAATEDNGRRAYDRIMQEDYDLILLDVMLPEMDGLTICQRVRELSDVPIIMLTARDEIDDKVKGLNIGADDYMTKPFATPELLARINVALRKRTRTEVREQSEGEVLRVKNLAMYTLRHEVMVG
ncbi:MAG: response regulator transcription factor, partial [Selenomonadaceae bacterium]|nr:response regulator transcription factor [Selenomonadaceae bacterium]